MLAGENSRLAGHVQLNLFIERRMHSKNRTLTDGVSSNSNKNTDYIDFNQSPIGRFFKLFTCYVLKRTDGL